MRKIITAAVLPLLLGACSEQAKATPPQKTDKSTPTQVTRAENAIIENFYEVTYQNLLSAEVYDTKGVYTKDSSKVTVCGQFDVTGINGKELKGSPFMAFLDRKTKTVQELFAGEAGTVLAIKLQLICKAIGIPN